MFLSRRHEAYHRLRPLKSKFIPTANASQRLSGRSRGGGNQMSALGGGLNRSTQHSISFYLLGFEPQGLARTASDAKVPGFSAAVKPRKYPRRFVTHSIFLLQDRECCVDRLNRPFKSRHLRCKKACPLYPQKPTCAAHWRMSAKCQ